MDQSSLSTTPIMTHLGVVSFCHSLSSKNRWRFHISKTVQGDITVCGLSPVARVLAQPVLNTPGKKKKQHRENKPAQKLSTPCIYIHTCIYTWCVHAWGTCHPKRYLVVTKAVLQSKNRRKQRDGTHDNDVTCMHMHGCVVFNHATAARESRREGCTQTRARPRRAKCVVYIPITLHLFHRSEHGQSETRGNKTITSSYHTTTYVPVNKKNSDVLAAYHSRFFGGLHAPLLAPALANP